MEVTFDYISPLKWMLGFKLTDDHFEKLKDNIKEAENNDANAKPKLAGAISKSLHISPESSDWFLREVFAPLMESKEIIRSCHQSTLDHALRPLCVSNDLSITPCMETFWVNYQKKHEFNPRHTHGGIFSFVIWVKIPYDHEDEKKLPFAESSGAAGRLIGNFSFLWSDGVEIQSKPIEMSPKMEAHGFIFPSSLHHEVYPFYTSDEERISVSGNIVYIPASSEHTDVFGEDSSGMEGQ